MAATLARRAALEQLPHCGDPGFEDALTTREMLITALASLPPRQRAIVVLRFFHDYTENRTAEELGIKVGTVKSQTARALAALRVDTRLDGGDTHPSFAPMPGGVQE